MLSRSQASCIPRGQMLLRGEEMETSGLQAKQNMLPLILCRFDPFLRASRAWPSERVA